MTQECDLPWVGCKCPTTRLQRAELLAQVKEAAHGPGVQTLRKILVELDRAEAAIIEARTAAEEMRERVDWLMFPARLPWETDE